MYILCYSEDDLAYTCVMILGNLFMSGKCPVACLLAETLSGWVVKETERGGFCWDYSEAMLIW